MVNGSTVDIDDERLRALNDQRALCFVFFGVEHVVFSVVVVVVVVDELLLLIVLPIVIVGGVLLSVHVD